MQAMGATKVERQARATRGARAVALSGGAARSCLTRLRPRIVFALPTLSCIMRRGSLFLNLVAPLGDRLTAGQQILALLIKVRILVPQPHPCAPPERILRRSFLHARP